jgi:predicted pyridoxine 5'-phosphate oxidase superfamily flavin-nucleotide-binding protein
MHEPRPLSNAFAIAFALATLVAIGTARSEAENVVYQFPALRGDVSTCEWFDENLNDRSEGALIRQTDALYNRLALPVGAPVTVTQTATTSGGTQLLGFRLDGAGLCAGVETIRPSPQPSS